VSTGERTANGPDYTDLRGRIGPANPAISERYAFHAAGPLRATYHASVRANFEWLAQLLDELLPNNREAALAQTHLQVACMFANAALALDGRKD
jgi:hypothetical protein